ncbi:unnamed protein product [marine sediment metagenome]|uniref:Uncharacterized protein n=1 Tax=marine sediment metagenome TaxID=412755 RepID=X1C7L9_9ZZZZ
MKKALKLGLFAYQDMGRVSHIRCQHPTCSNCPHLRYVFWVGTVSVGRVCIEKLLLDEALADLREAYPEAWEDVQ